MRAKILDLILSLSKDEGRVSCFFSSRSGIRRLLGTGSDHHKKGRVP